MTIEPKVLNQNNSQFGPKKSEVKWQISLVEVLGGQLAGSFFEGIKDNFQSAEYSRVIEKSLKRLKDFKTIDDLENMNEADLANFYFLGMSYLEFGEAENAASCFHIMLSQNRFVGEMLKGFSSYMEVARYQLEKLAASEGDEFVAQNDPGLFLAKKAGGKCFIATAVYGSEFTHDIVTLQVFRDRILSTSPLGRVFIRFYYVFSPNLARFFIKNRRASVLIRDFFIHPLAIRIRSKYCN